MDARELVKELSSRNVRTWEFYVARTAAIIAMALALYLGLAFVRGSL